MSVNYEQVLSSSAAAAGGDTDTFGAGEADIVAHSLAAAANSAGAWDSWQAAFLSNLEGELKAPGVLDLLDPAALLVVVGNWFDTHVAPVTFNWIPSAIRPTVVGLMRSALLWGVQLIVNRILGKLPG